MPDPKALTMPLSERTPKQQMLLALIDAQSIIMATGVKMFIEHKRAAEMKSGNLQNRSKLRIVKTK